MRSRPREFRARTVSGLITVLVVTATVALLTGGTTAAGAARNAADVPPGQTYQGTLQVRSQSTSIQGTVHGDVVANDHATVDVAGTVTGSIRAYGDSSVTVSGTVAQNVSLSTGTLDLQPGSKVGGNVETYNASSQVQIGGQVGGQARISASGAAFGPASKVGGSVSVWAQHSQTVEVQGRVDGDVSVSGTDLNLSRSASVGGKVHVYGGEVVGSAGSTTSSGEGSSAGGLPIPVPDWIAGAAIAILLVLLGVALWLRFLRRPPAPAPPTA